MSSTPVFNAEQLAAARGERWHQGGDALLTLEAARGWVDEAGLVLFAPRAHQLPMPAPSLVEATLGRAVSAPTAAETETARGLVARMVADGAVVPLNLLGGPGDAPDFVVSAQVFGYVFTLRGDKSWKQPPSTSGSVKVSPLALKVYEVLAQGNALSAAELADELGREVTENAISRALGELWAQMRVIPLLQQDGAATMWELTSRRFTKQIKAGANAGQPTALSALISVYLAQVFVAMEEEIETFLSPLSARSRTRDVLHGLTAMRQLENVVLEGKTLLYIPDALPDFPEVIVAEEPSDAGEIAGAAGAVIAAAAARPERIRRFDRPRGAREERGERPFRREGGERRERPARREGGERRGPAKPFGERGRPRSGEGKSFGEREQRPFQRNRAEGGGERREGQSFTRPWDEERKPRARRDEGERREGGRPFRREGEGAGREFRGKPAFGASKFGKGPRREFGDRPRREGAEGGERGERPFRPRREGEGGERPFSPRREGGREGAREGSGTRPQKRFRPRVEGEGGERPFRPRREGEGGARPFRPRREGEGGERPFRPRREGGGERTEGRGERPFRRREEGSREGGARRPFRSAEGGERSRPGGERRPGGRPGGKPGFGGKPKFGAKRGAGPRAGGPGGSKGKFGDRPKSGSRERNVRAKDMRGGKKGERGAERPPRSESEE